MFQVSSDEVSCSIVGSDQLSLANVAGGAAPSAGKLAFPVAVE